MKRVFSKLFIFSLAMAVTFALPACDKPNDDPNNEIQEPEEPEEPEDKLVLEDGTIVLTRCAGGIYFGDFWDEGIGDYYFLLTNDEHIGQTEQGFDVPMTPGRWLLFIDVWGALSEDHTNPIVPAGTYTWSQKRGENVLTADFTIATENAEQVGDQFRIVDHYFKDGVVVVEHTDKGYKIDARLTTTEGKEMKFTFEGEMTLEDKSDDEVYDPGIKDDVTISPVVARSYLYQSYENCDRHVLMLFDSSNLTYDNIHVNEPGMKLHLSLFNDPGAGLTGTYRAGEFTTGDILIKEPGVFYPGRMYGASTALGSFLERVNKDLSVEYAVLTDGEITITENSDGTHTVVGTLISDKGAKVSCNWTGVVTPHHQ